MLALELVSASGDLCWLVLILGSVCISVLRCIAESFNTLKESIVYWSVRWTVSLDLLVKIPTWAEMSLEIFAPRSKLSYDCAVSVGRRDSEGEDWSLALVCKS